MRRILLIVAMITGAALAAAPGALADSQTATSGDVTATYSYDTIAHKGYNDYSQGTITISRAGTVAYTHTFSGDECDDCMPLKPAVQVVDVNATGEPNVLVNLYTQGAHCCVVTAAYTYDSATGTYTEAVRNFEDAGYKLIQPVAGGPKYFQSEDDNFAYAFTAYAGSGEPIQIWSLQSGSFVDVTRSYPALVSKDAARWWRIFQHHQTDGNGVIAAWAADEELLGKDATVQSTLKKQLHAGHLNGGPPNGQRFINKLNALLVKLGYKK